MPFLTLLALLSSLSFAEEPCESTVEDVTRSTEEAFDAFLAMDVEAFQTSAAAAEDSLGCLREPLTPDEAAAYHRLQALSAFLDRDQDAAVARFRSSRVIDPDARLPEEIAPGGHPLDGLFRRADPDESGAIEPIEAPEGGRVWIDGNPDVLVRPVDRPAVIQLADPGETIVRSEYVLGQSGGPNWEGVRFAVSGDREPEATPEPEPVVTPEPAEPTEPPAPVIDVQRTTDTPEVTSAGPGASLAVVASVAALTSIGSYAAASAARSNFDDPSTPYEELEGLRGRTNSLIVVSGISAGVAVGFGVGALTVSF